MTSKTFVSAALALALAGCSLGASNVEIGNMPPPEQPPVDSTPPPSQLPPADPPPPAPRCDMGKTYAGFAGTDLTAGRIDGDLGPERERIKPFTALTGEVPRVLGNTPGLLADPSIGNTFSIVPNRWYEEPQASAVTVYTTYRIAFQGCLTATAAPAQFKVIPSNGTAATECGKWARSFWSRDATQPELDACVQVAMVDTSHETDPKRRWAYACASVMTAAGFTTY